jgi:PKD repeat protein
MNSFPKFGFFLLIIISSFALSCCKDECKGKSPTSADFKIYQPVFGNLKYTETNDGDTAVTTSITFSAQDSTLGNTYEWKIGSDDRTFTKREFFLDFRDKGTVSVRLIVKNSGNTCFPSNDGVDTLTKTIYITDDNPWIGNFEGYIESKPKEKFIISTGGNINRPAGAFLDNLPNGCNRDETYLLQQMFGNYKDIIFGEQGKIRTTGADITTCQLPWGTGTYSNIDKKLILNYQIWNTQQKKFINDRFIGIKK